MASIYYDTVVSGSPTAAWDVLDRYTRSELHVFSGATDEREEFVSGSDERPDGHYRVVTDGEGNDVWELNVSTDAEHKRASYTVPGLFGATHHHASMQIIEEDGKTKLVWITDVLPDSFAEQLASFYDELWVDLVKAVESGSDNT
jgi:hypothetical protein